MQECFSVREQDSSMSVSKIYIFCVSGVRLHMIVVKTNNLLFRAHLSYTVDAIENTQSKDY